MNDEALSETQTVLTAVIGGLRQQHSACNANVSGRRAGSCPWPWMWAEDVTDLADALDKAGYIVVRKTMTDQTSEGVQHG